jgi:hypothetical protein
VDLQGWKWYNIDMSEDTKPQTVTELKPGYYFSPGFYMGYWEHCILANFPLDVIKAHNNLTKHREMWVGAILAASDTKDSGVQHFVGLPEDEPPDVDIIYDEPTVTASGKDGVNRKHLLVEITRCDLDAGETLLGQILHKNTPAYEGMLLAVYVYGKQAQSDYQAVLDALKKEKQVYPTEIVCVEFVVAAGGGKILLPPGSYGISRLWPKPGSKLVNLSDKVAFFRQPTDVIGYASPRRGTGTEWQDLGSLTLLPPKIS